MALHASPFSIVIITIIAVITIITIIIVIAGYTSVRWLDGVRIRSVASFAVARATSDMAVAPRLAAPLNPAACGAGMCGGRNIVVL